MIHRSNLPFRTACLIGSVALAVALLPQPVSAAEVSWTNPADHLWNTNGLGVSNWSNASAFGPAVGDDAVFDLGVASPGHGVTFFNTSPTNSQLRVRNDDVTFILQGNTYTLTNNSFGGGVRVGENAGNVGTLTLFNPGTLTTPGTVNVGVRGTGTLNIFGSTVESVIGLIGDNSTGIGTVNVLGASSIWNLTGLGILAVGNVGTGTLNIDAGGEVNSVAATIGSFLSTLGGTGTVNVANATWNNTGLFTLGRDGAGALGQGTGTLNINTGGNVSGITTLHIGSTSEVNLKGGTLTTGTMEILGAFNFTQGTLNLTSGSGLTVGTGEMLGQTLSLQPGMVVNVTNGAGNVAAGGQLLISGSTASFSAVGGTNSGEISVTNGSLTYTAPMTQTGAGVMNLINATVTGGVTIDSGSKVFIANTATFNENTAGDTFVNNGVINVAGTATFNIVVSGSGLFSGVANDIIFAKGVSPGNSPGTIVVEGDAELTSTARLTMELAGPSTHDKLIVGGGLTVDGILDIRFLNYTPQLGDTFDLLDFNSAIGSFSQTTHHKLTPGLFFDTSSLLTTGSVTVVPEPTTAMLLGILGLAALRRRRLG